MMLLRQLTYCDTTRRDAWCRLCTNRVPVKPNKHITLFEEIGDFYLRKICVKFTDSRSTDFKALTATLTKNYYIPDE